MQRPASRLLLLVLGWSLSAGLLGSLTAGAARAHGGAYRGPSTTAPPASPADTVPTGAGGAGGGGGQSAPGGPGAPPRGSGGSSAGGTPAAAGPTSSQPRPSAPAGVDPATWSRWWELNKDSYVALKSHLRSQDIPQGSADFFLGGWPSSMLRDSLSPTRDDVGKRIVPALLQALSEEKHNEIVTGALIALARVGGGLPPAETAPLRAAFQPFLADANQEIAETAALSYGILGDAAALPLLESLLLDGSDGRSLVKATQVSYRTRSFAAYGLALLGLSADTDDVRARVVDALWRGLREDRTSTVDLGVACVIALGRVRLDAVMPASPAGPREEWPASSCRVAQVDALLAWFEDGSRAARARAHAPLSLAWLLEGLPESVREPLRERVASSLLRRVGPRSGEWSEVVQGCVIALGRMGDADADSLDARIRRELLVVAEDASNVLARRLATVAVARAAARPGDGAQPGSARAEVERALQRLLMGSTGERPWAALALGMLGRADRDEHRAPSRESTGSLLAALERSKSPSEVGAMAVAVGMMGVEDAVGPLHERLREVSEDEARGYLALALGLVGRRDSIALVQSVAAESRYRPELLRQAAVSLGLLGDKGAVPELVSMLAAARSLSSQAAIASALGLVGDARSIEPLLEVLADREHYTDAARGFAAVALGLVADSHALPWSSVFSADLNYHAAPPTLLDDRGTGILDIL